MILTILVAFCLITTIAFAWYNSSWLTRNQFTISYDTTVTAVIPMNASSGLDDADFTLQADCDDFLVIAADDTTKRSHDWENRTHATYGCGTSSMIIWSRMPSEAGWIYSSNAGASDQTDTVGTWPDAISIYHLSEGHNAYVNDSLNNYDLTTTGGSPTTVTGVFGDAWDFESGSSQYAKTDVSFANLTNFSVEFWVKPESEAALGVAVGKTDRTAGAAVRSWAFININYGGCNGKLTFLGFGDYCGGSEAAACSDDIGTGSWHHIVGTYNDSHMTMYTDGKAGTPIACNNLGFTAAPLMMGAHGTGQDYYDGSVDEVRIFNYSMSAAQVNASYQVGVNNSLHTIGAAESESIAPVITVYDPANATILNNTEDLLFNVYDETDANVDCWYSLNGAANVSLGSIANNTNASANLGMFTEGTHEVLSTCEDSTPANNSVNRVFSMVWDNLTSETFVSDAFELSTQTFEMILDTTSNITDVDANFTYNSTVYPADKFNVGSLYIFNTTRSIPMVGTNGTNITWFFNYSTDYNNGSTSLERQTTSRNQSIKWVYFPSGITSVNESLEGGIQYIFFALGNSSNLATLDAWVEDEGSFYGGTISNSTHATAAYNLPTATQIYDNRSAYGVLNVSYNGQNFYRNTTNTTYTLWRLILTDACAGDNATVGMTFTHLNEETRTGINGTFDVNASYFAAFGNFTRGYNNSFSTAASHDICISPAWATIYVDMDSKYNVTGFDTRFYFLRNAPVNNVTSFLDLHSLNSTLASIIDFTVQYPDGSVIPDAVIKSLRYYEGLSSYLTVSMDITNFDGIAHMPLRKDYVRYKFLVELNGTVVGDFTSMVISDDAISLTINEESLVEYFTWWDRIGWDCSLNSGTGVFSCTVTDTSGKMQQSSLEIDRQTVTGDWNNNCTTAAASSASVLTCALGNTTGQYYQWRLFGDFTNQRFLLDSGDIEGSQDEPYGQEGMLLTVFLIIGLATIGVFNPVASIFLAILALVVGAILDFNTITNAGIIGAVIAGVIIIWKMRS